MNWRLARGCSTFCPAIWVDEWAASTSQPQRSRGASTAARGRSRRRRRGRGRGGRVRETAVETALDPAGADTEAEVQEAEPAPYAGTCAADEGLAPLPLPLRARTWAEVMDTHVGGVDCAICLEELGSEVAGCQVVQLGCR